MVQKIDFAFNATKCDSKPEAADLPSCRGRGGRPAKEGEALLNALIRTNITGREKERLEDEYRRFCLSRRISFAGFIREKLLSGAAAPARPSREERLLETLQHLQDCRLVLRSLSEAKDGTNPADAAATLEQVNNLVERLAEWWFD